MTLLPVSKNQNQTKSGLLGGLRQLAGGSSNVRAEKARLEAFLDAVPGEYCGWAADGSVAYSEGFCKLLGIEAIKNIHDIQTGLSTSDAAALEGLFQRLQEKGETFSLHVQDGERTRTLKLSGTRGTDTLREHHFSILWLEDITEDQKQKAELQNQHNQMRDERDQLQAALDQLPIPLWMRNGKTEITWCNRAYAHAIDSSPATVIAEQRELPLKTARKSNPEAGRALAQAALDKAAAQIAYGHIILGGARKLMEISEIPLPATKLTLGMARDISREEELETEQRRYTTANNELLEQLGTAIGIFDGNQKLEFYNSAFSQLWQVEDAYLNTKPKLGDMMEKLRENRRLPEQADFKKYKQGWINMFTSLIQPHDEMLYLPDGSALRMLVVPHPMGGLMMTFEDVTSRLELESSYNTLIAVQKETLDNLAEGVSVFGGDGRLKLWNPSFARLWGFNPEELQGDPHINRLADKMKARFSEDSWPAARDAIMTQSLDRNIHEGKMTCTDGTQIAYSTVPLPDGGVLVTHVDVTDKMRVENALREKNAALETAEQVKLDFLANVSYQLRTPLNAIMGFAEILDNEYFGALNKKQKEYTHGMQDAGERLLSLINNILDLSTIEAGYMELQHDKVSVSDILNDIYDLTAEWARKERITVKMECPKNVGSFEADERRVKQVLLNLVRNAIAFTPEKGTITMKARRTKEHIEISVTDTGPGIAKEDQARLFEPFERSGHNRGSGAGLGLTLVKNIIELHGGTVMLDSDLGQGTTITVTLPLQMANVQPAKALA
ncbi:MAG: PAS domain-containing protein [Chloroflexi bacterium]|nr:PAS domain-containing protein [Chloroflexota bacterium]